MHLISENPILMFLRACLLSGRPMVLTGLWFTKWQLNAKTFIWWWGCPELLFFFLLGTLLFLSFFFFFFFPPPFPLTSHGGVVSLIGW
jgi:hypothetical protein